MKRSSICALALLMTAVCGFDRCAGEAAAQDFDGQVAPILRVAVSTAIPEPSPRASSICPAARALARAARAGPRSSPASPRKVCCGSGSNRTRCRRNRRWPKPRRPSCAAGSRTAQRGVPTPSIRIVSALTAAPAATGGRYSPSVMVGRPRRIAHFGRARRSTRSSSRNWRLRHYTGARGRSPNSHPPSEL